MHGLECLPHARARAALSRKLRERIAREFPSRWENDWGVRIARRLGGPADAA